MTKMDDLKSIYKYNHVLGIIKKSTRILIVTHEKPDGDALASMCSLSLLLDKLGCSYTLFCSDPISPSFSFLPNIDKVISDRDRVAGKEFHKFDLIIATDCGSISRTKLEEEIKNKQEHQFFIEIDHHPRKEKKMSNLEVRIPQAAASTEVIYYFLKHNGIKVNKDMADCILTGILTDTANFFHPSATKETISIASMMINRGAQFTKITKAIWQNKNLKAMKSWSLVLNNLRINQKYNIAFTVLTQKEMEEFQDNEEVMETITNSLNNLQGVRAVIFLRQEKKGVIRGNIRTNNPDIDVSKLANILGGGGHPKAAGFSIPGKIKKTKYSWTII